MKYSITFTYILSYLIRTNIYLKFKWWQHFFSCSSVDYRCIKVLKTWNNIGRCLIIFFTGIKFLWQLKWFFFVSLRFEPTAIRRVNHLRRVSGWYCINCNFRTVFMSRRVEKSTASNYYLIFGYKSRFSLVKNKKQLTA